MAGFEEVGDACVEELGAPLLLEASQGEFTDRVVLSWEAVAEAEGYLVYRGEDPVMDTPVTALEWEDRDAPAGLFPSPVASLTASEDDPFRVRLAWSPATVAAGAEQVYRVRAVDAARQGPLSAPATGWRGAFPVTRHEVSIDGGEWTPVGLENDWNDDGAAAGSLLPGEVSASTDDRVHVALEAQEAQVLPGATRSYRVRAVNARGAGDPGTIAEGRRGVGTVQYQWQWADESTGPFSDLPDAETRSALDTSIAPGDARWYRLRAEAEGVLPVFSEPVLGVRALDVGDACETDQQCGVSGCGDGVCGGPTAACAETEECVEGLSCASGRCGGPGAPCSDSEECARGECFAGLCGAGGATCEEDSACLHGCVEGICRCAGEAERLSSFTRTEVIGFTRFCLFGCVILNREITGPRHVVGLVEPLSDEGRTSPLILKASGSGPQEFIIETLRLAGSSRLQLRLESPDSRDGATGQGGSTPSTPGANGTTGGRGQNGITFDYPDLRVTIHRIVLVDEEGGERVVSEDEDLSSRIVLNFNGVTGGRGGRGGVGGNGARGQTGACSSGGCADLICGIGRCCCYSEGTNGGPGGDGGRGGNGGNGARGGNAPAVTLLAPPLVVDALARVASVEGGAAGARGSAGSGGNGGPGGDPCSSNSSRCTTRVAGPAGASGAGGSEGGTSIPGQPGTLSVVACD